MPPHPHPHPHGPHRGFRHHRRPGFWGAWPSWRGLWRPAPVVYVQKSEDLEKPMEDLDEPKAWYESPLGVLGLVLIILLIANMLKGQGKMK